MRRVLVDAARSRASHKRGHGAARANFDETAIVSPERTVSIVALDDALAAFAEVAPRQAKVADLRFFSGLQEEEIVESSRFRRARSAATGILPEPGWPANCPGSKYRTLEVRFKSRVRPRAGKMPLGA